MEMYAFVGFLSLLLALQQTVPSNAEVNCKCVDEWSSTLAKRIKAFKDPPPTEKYEYTGVIVGIMNAFFLPCTCTDVVRMTMSITIDDEDLYAEALSNTTVAAYNVSEAVTNMFPAMQDFNPDLKYRFEAVYATYVTKVAPSKSTYNANFILRGTNTTHLPDMVAAALADETVGLIDFKNGFTHLTPTVAKCTGTPAVSPDPAKILRVWNDDIIPPTEVTYTCPNGEYIMPLGKGKVTCQHDSLTWSALESLSCQTGCGLNPPDPPMNSYHDWDNSSRTIGFIVIYACKFGHSSGDGKNSTTECIDEGWTKLEETYYCKELPCGENIPQVPSHAITNYIMTKTEANTEITYKCIPGYVQSNKKDMTIKCNYGSWGYLSPTWSCINRNALSFAELHKGDVDLPHSQLTPEEIERKLIMLSERFYFWIVTIPSIIALMLCMIFCLCCTRIDSPLFHLCIGFRGNTHDECDDTRQFL